MHHRARRLGRSHPQPEQHPDLILENLTVVNPYDFEHYAHAVQLTCPLESTGQEVVSPTGHQMVLRAFDGSPHLTVRHCTLRPWAATR